MNNSLSSSGPDHIVEHVIHISPAGLLNYTFLNCLIQRKHLIVKFRYHLRTFPQIPADILRCISFKLIIDLVLKACPEIHGDRPDLDFYFRVHYTV